MIVQLQPEQVTHYWDGIKLALTEANRIEFEYREKFLNHALSNLLSGRFQCWVVFDWDDAETRRIYAIVVTSLVESKLYNSISLYIDCLYAFRKMSQEIIDDGIQKLKQYALNSGCSEIVAESSHPRVNEILEAHSFDHFKKYRLHI